MVNIRVSLEDENGVTLAERDSVLWDVAEQNFYSLQRYSTENHLGEEEEEDIDDPIPPVADEDLPGNEE